MSHRLDYCYHNTFVILAINSIVNQFYYCVGRISGEPIFFVITDRDRFVSVLRTHEPLSLLLHSSKSNQFEAF